MAKIGDDHLHSVIDEYLDRIERDSINDSYFNNPTLWAKDRLGVVFYDKQTIASDSVVNNPATAIKAGHGVGKSFWAAILACWWVDTRPIEKVFVATTAPSAAQVSGILWREIRKAFSISHKLYAEYLSAVKAGRDTTGMVDHPLPGYITMDNKWRGPMGELLAQGRKPPDNKAEDAFQGFHDGYVLAIGDEACGLSEAMIDGLDNITTNDNSRKVLIGNPTNPLSYFGKIFKTATGGWVLQTISVMDSPNFHGGGRCTCHIGEPLGLGMPADALANLTNQSFVDGKKLEYGEDSARYISRVLGEFAYDAGNSLFSEYDLAQAANAVVFADQENPYLVLGVDIARMGQDSTCVYSFERGIVQETDDELATSLGRDKLDDNGEPIRGGVLRFVDRWKKSPFVTRVMEDGRIQQGTSERINEIALAMGAKEVRIDASGNGQGVIDPLFVLAQGRYVIVEMYGSGGSPDRRAYHNNRSYRYSEMRRQFFQGLIDVDPEDDVLIEELGGIQYGFSVVSGGLLIESKDAIKKSGRSSPDNADAAWYASADLGEITGNPFFGVEAGAVAVSDLHEYSETGIHEYSW